MEHIPKNKSVIKVPSIYVNDLINQYSNMTFDIEKIIW